jgi:hypothetical protein
MGLDIKSLADAVPASAQLALAAVGGVFLLTKTIGLIRFIGSFSLPGTSVCLHSTTPESISLPDNGLTIASSCASMAGPGRGPLLPALRMDWARSGPYSLLPRASTLS